MDKEDKLVMVLATLGLVMIMLGLIVNSVTLTSENKRLESQLEEKKKEINDINERMDNIITENLKLVYQNENLWELYYSQVSGYDGEYYEWVVLTSAGWNYWTFNRANAKRYI